MYVSPLYIYKYIYPSLSYCGRFNKISYLVWNKKSLTLRQHLKKDKSYQALRKLAYPFNYLHNTTCGQLKPSTDTEYRWPFMRHRFHWP